MTTTTVEPTVDFNSATAQRVLNALDRCDRCGAQAYLAYDIPTKGEARPDYKVEAGEAKVVEMLFCSHHARKHEPDLAAMGATETVNDRHKLNEGNRQQGADHA